jgi:hypothetical protein
VHAVEGNIVVEDRIALLAASAAAQVLQPTNMDEPSVFADSLVVMQVSVMQISVNQNCTLQIGRISPIIYDLTLMLLRCDGLLGASKSNHRVPQDLVHADW